VLIVARQSTHVTIIEHSGTLGRALEVDRSGVLLLKSATTRIANLLTYQLDRKFYFYVCNLTAVSKLLHAEQSAA